VEPASPEATREVLGGLKERLEQPHRLHSSAEAIQAAADLAARHVPERPLPDAAIDLLDQAASRLRAWQDKEAAIAAQQYEAAARHRDREADLLAELERLRAEQPPPLVTAREVAEVVAEWAGKPAADLT
jgi:ATP-dependent Clp protease ATP-binding subunit ClpC